MGLSIFVLIKHLRISWFLRLRFYARSRNLEFTVHLPFWSNPCYKLDKQASICGRLYSVKRSLYRRSNAYFVGPTCLLRRERFLSTWHILAVGTIYLAVFFMLSSDLGCAWPARIFARVARALRSEILCEWCWHHDRLRIPVFVWLLHQMVGRGQWRI